MTGSPRACTRLAAESAPAGARLHAVGDQGVPFRRIAETTGHHLDGPARTISPEEAEAHFGFLSALVALDNPTSSASTQGAPGLATHRPGPARRPRPGGTTSKPDMVLTAAALPSLRGWHGGRTRTHALLRVRS